MTMNASPDAPAHVAIIMDGNGRWARMRGLPRTEGHKRGLDAAKRIVRAASEMGIGTLSLFVFSTENWRRAGEEVKFLMVLIKNNLSREFDFYRELGVRIVHSGDASGLPDDVRSEIESITRDTASNEGMTVNLAINYGGRAEIVRAANDAFADAGSRDVRAALTEADITAHLYQSALPPPDLIVRTAGEQRISNFLLWQSAYAELYFSDTLWPDWTEKDLEGALRAYSGRKRLYGGDR
jgi:undecaprenyl diphosphate synthase